MNKKHIIIVGMLLVILFVLIKAMKFDSGYKIIIINNIDKIVINLELKYTVGTTTQDSYQMESKKSYEYTIDTSNINDENAVILTYKDNNDNFMRKAW